MLNQLIKIYNTLALVETKGESTKTMALCLQYIEQLISNEQNKNQNELSKSEEQK